MNLDKYFSTPDAPTAVYFAAQLGLAPAQVSKWRKNGEVPVRQCALVESLTNGKCSRKELRPNDWYLYWPELKLSHSKIA